MIDIHCHILPYTDDGAESEEITIAMAKDAVSKGISAVIATPHHQNNRYLNPKHDIISKVEKIQSLLDESQIPLQVLPGQEIRIYGELLEDIESDEIMTLNHTYYLLIELPFDSVPFYAQDLLADLRDMGFIPIIAHPERNMELVRNPQEVYDIVQLGCLTQVTAASVIGRYGPEIKRFSEHLIEMNLTHFVASDAHNMTNRTFDLNTAYDKIAEKFTSEQCVLFQENSNLLVQNKKVIQNKPLEFKKKNLFNAMFKKN